MVAVIAIYLAAELLCPRGGQINASRVEGRGRGKRVTSVK